MPKPRVLSVGQCSADHGSISSLLSRQFDATIDPAHTVTDAWVRLENSVYDLLLVNRIFDYDSTSGIDFIKQLKSKEEAKDIPVMLVSNHLDAQTKAIECGAIPGFGKASLNDSETLSKLRAVLAKTA